MIRCLIVAALIGAAFASEPAFTLVERLDAPDVRTATVALHEAGHRGVSSSEELLVVHVRLGDADPTVRMAAAGAAARMRDDAAVPLLAEGLRDADAQTAEIFRTALVAITGSDHGGSDADAWKAWHDEAEASTRAGIETLRAAVAAGDPEKARAALHPLLMPRCCRELIAEALAEVAQSDNPRLAALAREGLSNLAGPQARLAMIELGILTESGELAELERPGNAVAGARPSFIRQVLSPQTGLQWIYLLLVMAALVTAVVWWAIWLSRKYPVVKAKVGEATRLFKKAVTRTYKKATARFTRARQVSFAFRVSSPAHAGRRSARSWKLETRIQYRFPVIASATPATIRSMPATSCQRGTCLRYSIRKARKTPIEIASWMTFS
jgi:hypothetical protein